MLSRPFQLYLSRTMIVAGLILGTHGVSTYVAWRHCDRRYAQFLFDVDQAVQLRDLLRTRDDDKTWSWFRSHHPSGKMYSGWAEMGLLAFGGTATCALGCLGVYDLRRRKESEA